MINIKIICVGALKEKAYKELQDEFAKRLSKYCKLEIIELKDEKLPNISNESNNNIVKLKEGQAILSKLPKNSFNFILDERGTEYTSVELAEKLQKITNTNSTITFVIGGSLGLSDEVKKEASELISFSKLTFPHQMIRVFLLEQIFRVFKIQNGETYHH